MKTYHEKKRSFVKFFVMMALVSGCFASAHSRIIMRASIDKNTVALDDYLILSVEVSGDEQDIEKPKLPSLPNFNIHSSGRTQNVSIINGKISSSLTYKYTLTPRFTGKAVIEAITLTHNGKTYSTSPIEITVVRAGSAVKSQTSAGRKYSKAPPSAQRRAGGKDVFMTAWINKKSAFIGEQIILTIRFYHAVALLGNPQYNPPSLDNFISEDLPPNTDGIEDVKGRDYHYIELKTALFGVTSGKAVINPAEIVYNVRKNVNLDPFADDFISQFFSQAVSTAQTASVQSNPITVEIKPLPEKGRPLNFTGAVGQYKINAFLDKSTVKAGELANFAVKISGSGNLKTVTAPKFEPTNDLHIYDTVTSLDIEKKNNIVRGYKIFKTVISPKKSAEILIPPVNFSYFDHKLEKYVTIATLPVKLKALPSDEKESVKYSFSGSSSGEITAVSKDINYIRENADFYKTGFFTEINSLGSINLISVFIFIIGLAVYFVRKFYFKNSKAIKYKKAYSAARYSLKKAKKLITERKFSDAMTLLSDILNDYLLLKTHFTDKPVTDKEFLRILKLKFPRLSDADIKEIKDFQSNLDMLKFAPMYEGTSDYSGHLAKNLENILKNLERKLKK